jgi:hypothetical protein
MNEHGLDTITHAAFAGTNNDNQNLILFQRVNAREAEFVILESKHYLELIRAAADGRVAKAALKESSKVLQELFVTCDGAADAYLMAVGRMGETKNADV